MSGIAVNVENLSKKFRVFHERRDSIFESIIGSVSRKKFYEYLNVLDDVTFSVNKGEMFGIIGKNGAGKSTLLKLISGIFESDKGKIVVNGKLIPLLSLGLGFQVDLTARTNVIQYGLLLGFEKKQILD
ncbi:MAG: ATP-binding cassette domain-containing protein, partial [Nitrosopumilus sp.]|nr:ATP-binding cassette domain-containing protein [Nitrosopumilus sp.]